MHEVFSEESAPRYATFCPDCRAAVENVPTSAETRRPGMRAPDLERRRARITGGSRWAMLGQKRLFAPDTGKHYIHLSPDALRGPMQAFEDALWKVMGRSW